MTAVNIDNVSVLYHSPTDRNTSIKEAFVKLWEKKEKRKEREYFHALSAVNLELNQGECVAFVGPNGCGKSTLLKVIAGVLVPQHGKVDTRGIIAPMIELGAGFDQELSGIDNIWMACRLMGASNKLIRSKLNDIIAFADLGDFIHAPVKTYSSGMYMRLGFSCSTIINPEILLIDEILAVGDAKFQRKCLDRIHQIKASGKTIVIVTHDQSIVESLCDRAIFLWSGKIVYDGTPAVAFQVYNRMMANPHLQGDPAAVVEEVLRLGKLGASANTKNKINVSHCSINGGLKSEGDRRIVEIECSFELSEPPEKAPTVGFQLRHSVQGRVYGANTRNEDFSPQLSQVWQENKAGFYIKWHYDCSVLSTGRYMVDICISDYEIIEIYEFIKDAFFFDIVNPKEAVNADTNLVELEAIHFSATLMN